MYAHFYEESDHVNDDICHIISRARWNLNRLCLTNTSSQDCDKIGPQGLKKIVTPWRNLIKLFLENSRIGDQGCKIISTSRWQSLKVLWLCKFCFMKSIAEYPKWVVSGFPKVTGIIYRFSLLVFQLLVR